MLKSNTARVILLTNFLLNITYYFNLLQIIESKSARAYLTRLYLQTFDSVLFPYFNSIFCTLVICFVFDGLLYLVYFRTFCSQKSIPFEKTYLLSCWFHCVDIFYIKCRFCETLSVINSINRILLIETLYKFRTFKCWFTLYLHIYGLG